MVHDRRCFLFLFLFFFFGTQDAEKLLWFMTEDIFSAEAESQGSSCAAHILKSQHTLTFDSKYSRALTFENVCRVQGSSCADLLSLSDEDYGYMASGDSV